MTKGKKQQRDKEWVFDRVKSEEEDKVHGIEVGEVEEMKYIRIGSQEKKTPWTWLAQLPLSSEAKTQISQFKSKRRETDLNVIIS